jgi:hypothetical protein
MQNSVRLIAVELQNKKPKYVRVVADFERAVIKQVLMKTMFENLPKVDRPSRSR